jgi:hypothetical protein
VNDFFNDVSYGKCNLDGSRVFGWYTLPYTKAEDSAKGRYDRIVTAAAALQDKVDFTPFYGICIILNVYQDSGAVNPGVVSLNLNKKTQNYGIVVLDPWGWQPSVACQELSHGFNLSNHSRNATNPTQDYGNPFDIMSTLSNCYMFSDPKYDLNGHFDDNCGPGMNTPNLDEFGWLDSNRIYEIPTVITHNSVGINRTEKQTFTIQLSPVNHPETGQFLCATLETSSVAVGPFRYYFEYRTADGWDRGMNGIANCIVIQQQRSDDYNYLVFPQQYSNCLRTGDSFYDAEKDITVTALDFKNHVATVEVTLPVRQVYRTPVAGPGPTDWHIYEEALRQQLNVAEHSIQSIKSMLKILDHQRMPLQEQNPPSIRESR